MLSFFGGSEVVSNQLELSWRQNYLGHVQTYSELGLSDVTASQFVEVSEELSHSDPLFFAQFSDSGNAVVNVFGSESHYVIAYQSGLVLREVREGLVVVSPNSKNILRTVNLIAEVNVVYFLQVAHVHVSLQESIHNIIRSHNLELVEHSQELGLSNMAVLGNIKVLEHWL